MATIKVNTLARARKILIMECVAIFCAFIASNSASAQEANLVYGFSNSGLNPGVVKASPGFLAGYSFTSDAGVPAVCSFYNTATPVFGSTAPAFQFYVGALGNGPVSFTANGLIPFNVALSVICTGNSGISINPGLVLGAVAYQETQI